MKGQWRIGDPDLNVSLPSFIGVLGIRKVGLLPFTVTR